VPNVYFFSPKNTITGKPTLHRVILWNGTHFTLHATKGKSKNAETVAQNLWTTLTKSHTDMCEQCYNTCSAHHLTMTTADTMQQLLTQCDNCRHNATTADTMQVCQQFFTYYFTLLYFTLQINRS